MINVAEKVLVILVICSVQCFGQSSLPIPSNIQVLYKNGTRSQDGKPGPKYWQNTADYTLQVDYNPSTRLLRGTEKVIYTNNSPDTLYEIVVKLYPNLFKKGSPRLASVEPEDVTEGIQIDNIGIANTSVITWTMEGTNMSILIPPLLPGESTNFSFAFHYTLNKGRNLRTGQVEENVAFIAYFFPRIAVYDDIDGWNRNQYLGTQEFYNDFCNFKASVTVPKDFVVWATGDLKNCSQVFTPKYCNLIRQAETTDSITTIIDSTDLINGNITTDSAFNTWQFEATNVTDFVFAVSNHYMWKSSSVLVDATTGRRTRTDAVFNQKHSDYFDVVKYNRETVHAMSYSYPAWPFPYSHETVFDGLDQMEYPMMVNDNPVATTFDAITLTTHEVFHTMFPFYVGINETKYGWMDEGWATTGEWIISPLIDSSIVDTYGMKQYEAAAGTELDLPITTLTTQLNGTPMFLNSYIKPALGYLYIKDYLGDKLFTKALHYYIQQWHGKHPTPYDFFNCINTGSGKNLNWFFKQWFFDNGVPDLAIAKVKKSGKKYTVTIESKGTKPLPVDLNITLDDNTVLKEHRNIGAWENGDKSTTISFRTDKDVLRMTLGGSHTPDVNKNDNSWER